MRDAARRIKNDISLFTTFALNNADNLVHAAFSSAGGKDRPQSREHVYRGF